ncbi:MAG: zinc ABC transporter substrate-binding protein [Gammaproteobacteria bacterium]|nr:zinc ABC transporter substrate-binding protein [Gammaproteobacteria bacterium]
MTLIARDVAGDLAEVRQLLPDGASPHEYALRVSDRRLLGAADVVLWVGPVLEPYLNNAVAGMVPGRVLTAADLPGIVWPESSSDKTGVEQGRDEHLWLDPRNARIIARALAQALVARSPDTAQSLFWQSACAVSKRNWVLSKRPFRRVWPRCAGCPMRAITMVSAILRIASACARRVISATCPATRRGRARSPL